MGCSDHQSRYDHRRHLSDLRRHPRGARRDQEGSGSGVPHRGRCGQSPLRGPRARSRSRGAIRCRPSQHADQQEAGRRSPFGRHRGDTRTSPLGTGRRSARVWILARIWHAAGRALGNRPLARPFGSGRYWVRTSDLFGVNEARYHCANRPQARCASTTLSHLQRLRSAEIQHSFCCCGPECCDTADAHGAAMSDSRFAS